MNKCNEKICGKRIVKTIMILFFITIALIIYSMKSGSIHIGVIQLIKGLFIKYDEQVAIIYDMRFPRIIVAWLAGAGLAVSGLLFQSILKNPLADPGIIGISGGAALTAAIITSIFPSLFFSVPIISCVGGFLAYILIYSLAWRGSLESVRIILVGVAVAAIFASGTEIFDSISRGSNVIFSINRLSQLVWKDVYVITLYVLVGLLLSLILSPICNLMSLEDETVRGLGIDADKMRLLISSVAVLLASGVTAVIGIIGFLALVSPHISKKLVGHNHKILIPTTALVGGIILLLADTVGRLIFMPHEIPASILMSLMGGPFFIILLRKESNGNAN